VNDGSQETTDEQKSRLHVVQDEHRCQQMKIVSTLKPNEEKVSITNH
jgi:hypothetical protein